MGAYLMARFATIDAGRVTNIIEAEAAFAASIGAIDAAGAAIGDLWNGSTFSKPAPPPFDRVAAGKEIDAAVIAVYDRPMALSKEYEAREKAAADYKAAGYTGTVPARLAGFAAPAGMTSTDAADLILEKAAQLRNALDLLSDLRMRKYEVQRATTEAEARTAYADVITEIAAVAASLV